MRFDRFQRFSSEIREKVIKLREDLDVTRKRETTDRVKINKISCKHIYLTFTDKVMLQVGVSNL